MLHRTNNRRTTAVAITALLLAAALPATAEDLIVPDLVSQFEKIAHHGDPLGFHLGVGTDPDVCRHWQGIARYDTDASDPYLLVTKSGNKTDYWFCTDNGWCGSEDCPGELLIVHMASRDRDGERLRSNRLLRNVPFDNTVAPSMDEGVSHIIFDGSYWPAYQHPGSVQVVGDIAVVALERPISNPDSNQGALCFIDISNPTNPILVNTIESFDFKIGVVGVTRQANGKYLFLLTGGSNEIIEFWESNTTDLYNPNLALNFVNITNAPPPSDKWVAWQAMNLYRSSDGFIYAACSGNDGFGGTGADWLRLYRVTGSAASGFVLSYVAERHLYFNEPSLGAAEAGPGFHVTDSGQLIFYCTEHDNDGPGGTVKMGEWRSYDVTHDLSVDACGGWVEFYEDSYGWEDPSPDRSIVWDFADRNLENWDDLSNMGWDDDIDSVRWNLPPGLEVRLYQDANFGITLYVLTGSGAIGDLGSNGDEISSVRASYGAARVVDVYPGQNFAEQLSIASVCRGDHPELRVHAGSHYYTGTITKPVRLVPVGGSATIIAP